MLLLKNGMFRRLIPVGTEFTAVFLGRNAKVATEANQSCGRVVRANNARSVSLEVTSGPRIGQVAELDMRSVSGIQFDDGRDLLVLLDEEGKEFYGVRARKEGDRIVPFVEGD